MHIDIALNQFVSESVAIGIYAFHLPQITKNKGNVAITAKCINDFSADNRLEGDRFYFTVAGSS